MALKGIGMTGTIRKNRTEGCPLIVDDRKEKRGTIEYKTNEQGTIIIRWKDNKSVLVGSTVHGVQPIGTTTRYSRCDKSRVEVQQPNAIKFYNRFMGGVDRMDENISHYRINIRSKKWWWPLFAMLVDCSMHNAWQLYRDSEAAKHRPLDHLQFRRQITQTYLQVYGRQRSAFSRAAMFGPRRKITSMISDEVRIANVEHRQASRTQRRCKQCGKNTKRYCVRCDVSLHDSCVVAFHSK